jgi:hypothetical protein
MATSGDRCLDALKDEESGMLFAICHSAYVDASRSQM